MCWPMRLGCLAQREKSGQCFSLIGLAGVPEKRSFPELTGGSSFHSATQKSIPTSTTPAGDLRGLTSRLLNSPQRALLAAPISPDRLCTSSPNGK